MTQIGVDETAFKKRHDYVTIVSDQEAGTVLFVGEDRKKATAASHGERSEGW
uniref:transposase n=1 Tax=Thiolapillus sp. TaxID=2017437 RepID=UPI003AF5D552